MTPGERKKALWVTIVVSLAIALGSVLFAVLLASGPGR
jgi:hypothetical protein